MSDHVDFIIRFESGKCESDEEVIEGFQELLDSKVLFHLQGSYGRMGMSLIEQGLIVVKEKQADYYGNLIPATV